MYPACLVYKGVCSCLEDYIGETKQNSVNRWAQHNHPSKKSNPAIHIKDHVEHQFHWSVISIASQITKKRKIQKRYS